MLITEKIPFEMFTPETPDILSSVVTGRLGETLVFNYQQFRLQECMIGMDVSFVLFSDSMFPKTIRDWVRRTVEGGQHWRYFDAFTYAITYSEGYQNPESHNVIAKSLFFYPNTNKLLSCSGTEYSG